MHYTLTPLHTNQTSPLQLLQGLNGINPLQLPRYKLQITPHSTHFPPPQPQVSRHTAAATTCYCCSRTLNSIPQTWAGTFCQTREDLFCEPCNTVHSTKNNTVRHPALKGCAALAQGPSWRVSLSVVTARQGTTPK